MAKSKQPQEKIKKAHNPVRKDLLKTSKAIKIMATYAALSGLNKRQVIRIMGDAENTFRDTGRPVIN